MNVDAFDVAAAAEDGGGDGVVGDGEGGPAPVGDGEEELASEGDGFEIVLVDSMED
ncbi:hypothetical protein QJS10_CPA02g01191 [Acorus calamus]|uniref:Uncharacterized protein n=1 Tax=Acorus calamus TaxID=4465 RepID=A0AAV9FBC6_ACOCL|nr:hypothetical protein QJS10_CPA02g01191 [Acorus calamus]